MDHSGCSGCSGGGLDRRMFISQSALAAAALVLTSCWGDKPFLAGPPPLDASINVNDYPELANVDGAVAIVVNNQPIAVVRTGANSFAVLSRTCPHQSGLIVPNGAGWRCTGHGALFTLTGDWMGGQETFDMAAYATSYNATTGVLTIA